MFVRFRRGKRLQVSLIETSRIDGRVRHEHVASLGAVDTPPSVADRAAFWRGLHERLSKLSNRIDAAVQGKILGQVHARIPMVSIDELRALQLENTEADERFWDGLRDMHEGTAEDHRRLLASIEKTIATAEAHAKHAAEKAETAKDRASRLREGKPVAGGLDKPLTVEDMKRIMREAGMTTKDIEHCQVVAAVYDLGGWEEMMEETHKRHMQVEHAVARAVLRRRLEAIGKGEC